MKIERAVAVAFFASLGIPKAGEWENDKLVARLKLVPEKIAAKDVKGEFLGLYEELVGRTPATPIELTGSEPAEPAPKEKSAKTKPAAKAKVPAAKKEKTKAPPKEPKEKKTVEKDSFGFRTTSDRSKVLCAVEKGGVVSLDEIAKATKLEAAAVKNLLGWASRSGLIVVDKKVTYQVAKKK